MRWYSLLAIYLLFWTFTLFLVLPYGNRVAPPGEHQPGHAESAPNNLSMPRKLAITTVLSVVLFALFYANFTQGWITLDDIPGWRPANTEDLNRGR